jgi:hypothetical protein
MNWTPEPQYWHIFSEFFVQLFVEWAGFFDVRK